MTAYIAHMNAMKANNPNELDLAMHLERASRYLEQVDSGKMAEAASELRRLYAALDHQMNMAHLMLREAERNGKQRDSLLDALKKYVEHFGDQFNGAEIIEKIEKDIW